MNYNEMKIDEFIAVLASKEPVPGGGGASALVGAVGTALGNMVGSLTLGKKKYADVEEDIIALKSKADALQSELLELIQADAECFTPLSEAYGLPKGTEEEIAYRNKVMEEALALACSVPLKIMEACCRAIDITDEFAKKGSRLAISDAGVSATMLRAALFGASLNVSINTQLIKNREYASELDARAEEMLSDYGQKAEEIFESVRSMLK